jgi:signal transduction histidine kinase
MEWEFFIFGVLPLAAVAGFLLLLVVSQTSGFLQSRHHLLKERRSSRVIRSFLQKLAMSRTELGRRARELDRLTRTLRLKNDELERLSNMKSRFLSMAVHDVRTPLTVIRGYSQMLTQGAAMNPNQERMVGNISRATDQINRLMGDLTDLAVIEAGKFRMEPTSFDLAQFVSEMSAGASLLAAKKGVVYECPEPPAGVNLFADRFRVGRLITNFLGNAIKFTPSGGRVELRARMAGAHLIFEVKDTGPGIDASERRKIFEKFYQSRFADSKARSGGWGLGLAISDEIARAHGGSLGVDSPGLGRGSTFWFKLPLKKPKAPPSERTAAPLRLTNAQGAGAGKSDAG